MMTVVDQVSPWLMPEQHVGGDDPAPARCPDQQQRHGQRDEPADDQDRLAAEAVRQGAGEVVGGRLGCAEGEDERQSAGVGAEPELALGEQRQDGAFLAEHPADERVDRDEQAELGEVRSQPQLQAGRASCGGLHGSVSSVRPVARPQSSGPPRNTATSWCPARSSRLAAPAARSPWPHITTTGSSGNRLAACGQRAELDVASGRHVPTGELRQLADVEQSAITQLIRADQLGVGGGFSGGDPGVHSAGQLSDDALVADLDRLPDDLLGVLVGIADDDQ